LAFFLTFELHLSHLLSKISLVIKNILNYTLILENFGIIFIQQGGIMPEIPMPKPNSALEDFHSARSKANMQEIIARLRGKPVTLLSFDETRQKLKVQILGRKVIKDIPLASIVGSVNRYEDFTRDFLPRKSIDPKRWAGVKDATYQMMGLPPIEAYQIGEVFFVSDGNHRVSVAKEMGAKTIQGYVTEIRTRVPLTPDVDPNDLIIKSEYVDFLVHTQLDRIRPDSNLSVTSPGQYEIIEEHISVHRYYMGVDPKRAVTFEAAVAHWYDEVYLPVIQVIYEQGLPRNFPKRTETDLYLWIAEHQASLEKEFGDQIDSRRVAYDMTEQFNPKITKRIRRFSQRIHDLLTPDSLEAGPRAGFWRESRQAVRRDDRLFSDILVAITGKREGWLSLEQAILIAQREESRLHGLYIVRSKKQKANKEAEAIQAEFSQRCEKAGVSGKLVIASGEIARKITERAAWNDLVVVKLAHPIGPRPFQKLSSGFRHLILRCPQPILVVPQRVSSLTRALLAFDGSPKAKEALFVTAYMAEQWKITIVMVTIYEKNPSTETQEAIAFAQNYLKEHGLQAVYAQCDGPVAPTLLVLAEETQSDLIIMGGYGTSPIFNLLSDDVVDQILRGSGRSILLCR
jgi:nucleotide-binding universal stress UspA family protein